jgi:hypothetical protein
MNRKRSRENPITFQFKSNQNISLLNGWTANGGQHENGHESEVYYRAPITCHGAIAVYPLKNQLENDAIKHSVAHR